MKPTILMILMINSVICLSQNDFSNSLYVDKYKTENGDKIVFNSKILDIKKEIFIGLPKNFNDSVEYPLIIVLEGEFLFETFAPLTRLMAEANEIPECVVVGIPFYNRHLDYAPKISSHPESGDADKMLEFFRIELFPLKATP